MIWVNYFLIYLLKMMKQSVKFKFFNIKNGKSKGIYNSLNCGLKSKDNKNNVKKNIEIAKNLISKEKKVLIIPTNHIQVNVL